MRLSRRSFLGTTAAVTVCLPALLRSATSAKRLPIGFSTLGCPAWSWRTILDRAAQWGYAAIELRGLQGELDLTNRAEFSPTRMPGTRQDLEALGLRVVGLGASARMHETEAAKRAAQLDEGRRFIDLAEQLKAPYVRVFGDQLIAGRTKAATIERVVSGLRELGDHAKGSGVTVVLESHGDFCDSPTLMTILENAAHPKVALLWDAHHTVVAGKEAPADTWHHLGRYVRHVHLKDSRPEGQGVRYVLTGTGTIPLSAVIAALVSGGYRGCYSFEWEKTWHPEIEEPDIAFPQFAKAIAVYLEAAGYQPA